MKTKIYIAGPMTGLPEFNYPAFFEAQALLQDLDYDVFNPAALPMCIYDLHDEELWQWYMKRAIPLLLECEQVCLLKGWGTSKGAKLEVIIAKNFGMRLMMFSDTNILRSMRV